MGGMDRYEMLVRNLDRIVHHFEELNTQTVKLLETAVEQVSEAQRAGDAALDRQIVQHVEAIRESLRQADRLERERVAALEYLVEARFEGALEARKVLQETLSNELTTHTEQAERRFRNIEEKTQSAVPVELYDERHRLLQTELAKLQEWRANLSGRFAAMAVIGTLFVASVTALITHLIGAG